MHHIYDMIIIGGGSTGYTAALYAARADKFLIDFYTLFNRCLVLLK